MWIVEIKKTEVRYGRRHWLNEQMLSLFCYSTMRRGTTPDDMDGDTGWTSRCCLCSVTALCGDVRHQTIWTATLAGRADVVFVLLQHDAKRYDTRRYGRRHWLDEQMLSSFCYNTMRRGTTPDDMDGDTGWTNRCCLRSATTRCGEVRHQTIWNSLERCSDSRASWCGRRPDGRRSRAG